MNDIVTPRMKLLVNAEDEYTLLAIQQQEGVDDMYDLEIIGRLRHEFTGRRAGVRVEIDMGNRVQYTNDAAIWRDQRFINTFAARLIKPGHDRVRLQILGQAFVEFK